MASSILNTGTLHCYRGLPKTTPRLQGKKLLVKCSIIPGDIAPGVQQKLTSIESVVPVVKTGISLVRDVADLPDNQRWFVLSSLLGAWIYGTARPGVLIGAMDAYIFAPLQVLLDTFLKRRNLKRTDFVVGERMGEGSFGIVYAGTMLPSTVSEVKEEPVGRRAKRIEEYEGFQNFQKVILKKVKIAVEGAEECGNMEEWFNYRLSRAAPDVCANFLGSFISDATRGQFTEGGRWLVWKFEGDSTLADFMKDRNFPKNLEQIMFKRSLKGLDSLGKNSLIIKQIMRQIITSLKKIHDTGIVHRDIKPSNLVVTKKGKVKLIDFGAATDLRVGKNYVPDSGMLDPDYCPPELYVLPEETPKPPPEPIAAILSPILWQLNSPDLFDMYSAGVIFLQMACSNLRTTSGLRMFKSEIKQAQYDLRKWRQTTRLRPDLSILDSDGGKGWDLATKLISERGFLRRGRLSAAAALSHPYFLLAGDQAAAVLSKFTFAD
uniref:TSA: Wollemia nobilis Ref_Wollemi_Transcript_8305_1759 transcribed RNA sequence n=1 Tax=Wollemia nobilis TaxID=56998 RepID=A0A0C9S7J7_9CONI